jgi:hypothetical protein
VFDRGRSLCWSPPTLPNVKVNFDVAVGDSGAELAAVCRDHKANVLFIWTELIDSNDPLLAKAKASLLAARKINIVEGDSLQVIHAIQTIPSA